MTRADRKVVGRPSAAPLKPAGGERAGTLAREAAGRFPPGTVFQLLGRRSFLGTFEAAFDARARPVAVEVSAALGVFVDPAVRPPDAGPGAPCRWARGRGPLALEARPVAALEPRVFLGPSRARRRR